MTFTDLQHKAGLTTEEIATLSGVKVRQVYRWKAEQARVPKLVVETLERILKEKQAIK